MAGHHTNYKWNGPLPRPHVSAGHRIATKFLGATMFFWMFLRIKEVSKRASRAASGVELSAATLHTHS